MVTLTAFLNKSPVQVLAGLGSEATYLWLGKVTEVETVFTWPRVSGLG